MVVNVFIDNPPVNILDERVIEELAGAFANIDEATRVIVLRGAGTKAFSAGGDLARFLAAGGELATSIQEVVHLIEAAPVPVIAGIEGYCFGGGLELALACDLRIAHKDAQLGLPEVRLGILPGGGGTQRLPRFIGPARATWMIMSGEWITATTAAEWGLVEASVSDLNGNIDRMAGSLAVKSRSALREIKQLLYATRHMPSDELETEAFLRCLASDDGQEGIAAFLEKRTPRFS